MIKGLALCLAVVLGMPTVGTLAAQLDNVASSGRVEVVLANEHRKDLEEIKKEFADAGLTNLHVQFMKVGNPPTNIDLGPSVTAERARAAIRMAKKYNRDVTILLPERLFPDHYVAIASSSFDDTVEYPSESNNSRSWKIPRSQRSNFTCSIVGSRGRISRR